MLRNCRSVPFPVWAQVFPVVKWGLDRISSRSHVALICGSGSQVFAQLIFFALLLAAFPGSTPPVGPPPHFSVSHLQRFHIEPGFQPLEILLSNSMPRGSAFSLSPRPLTIHESGACESGDAQDGLSSELDTCGQCQGEGFGACLLRFLGTCPVLPVSLPQVPGFLPAKNATPFPSHCLHFLGSAQVPTTVPQSLVGPLIPTPTVRFVFPSPAFC